MAKAKNPKTLSGHFNIDPRLLDSLGVLNPTLAIDTKLFIDPLLLKSSTQPEMQKDAVIQYRSHFENVIKLLAATTNHNDVAWRTAEKLLEFHEITGTCLGYGAASIHGSAFGRSLTGRLLKVGKEIVDLGVSDPDLFPLMALFEENIGSDRISDMVTNVILESLITFNERILKALKLDGEEFEIVGKKGVFLRNPFEDHRTPIILVPKDILRSLPIAKDWDEVAAAADRNEALRNRVNAHIAHIWAKKTHREKRILKHQALLSKASFQSLLDSVHDVDPVAYDVDRDPEALLKWAHIGETFSKEYPLDLGGFRGLTGLDDVTNMVRKIIENFQHLVEHNGLNKELYKENAKPRHESTAQNLFFATAYGYCEANNIDITPEADTGTGRIDFKVSRGFEAKVLVEIKLSTNQNVAHGYETQLEIYKKSERTMRAFYVVIDVGRMGKKDELLIKTRNEAAEKGHPLSEIIFIDGGKKPPASKR